MAVLSALNIAEDFLKEQEKSKGMSTALKGEIDKLTEFFDTCLMEEDRPGE